jgi:hypothetical protein
VRDIEIRRSIGELVGDSFGVDKDEVLVVCPRRDKR